MDDSQPRRLITSPILLPSHGNASLKRLCTELPKWGGSLEFRNAKPEEAGLLKTLYEDRWNDAMPERAERITISHEQILQMIANFPQGQIVGCEIGSDEPVSMINIMLSIFRKGNIFPKTYRELTDDRTFKTSIKPRDLAAALASAGSEALPMAYCVSVISKKPPKTEKKDERPDWAFETLNYAILFAITNHLIPAPYSAPRGYASALQANPDLDIRDYLHMTKPRRSSFNDFMKTRFKRVRPRFSPAFNKSHESCLSEPFGGLLELDQTIFNEYNLDPKNPADSFFATRQETAYARFLLSDKGHMFSDKYGREMTIEDFIILSGRELCDFVIGMHIDNGARHIRDESGNLIAILAGSRPEDHAAAGINVVLTYSYHPFFGHSFASL